jgi:hypothetical protein
MVRFGTVRYGSVLVHLHCSRAPSHVSATQARHSKALDLLARGWPSHLHLPDPVAGGGGLYGPAYDPDHALVLCRLHGFRKGLLFLYDKLRLPREVLQARTARGPGF